MKKSQNNILAYRILIIIAVIVWILAWNLWPLFPSGSGIFYQGNATHLLLLYFIFWQREEDPVIKSVLCIGFWLAVNDLADELFFDPLHFGLNEYVYALFVVSYTVYNHNARKKDAK